MYFNIKSFKVLVGNIPAFAPRPLMLFANFMDLPILKSSSGSYPSAIITPAVIVDEVVKIKGRVPSEKEILEAIK